MHPIAPAASVPQPSRRTALLPLIAILALALSVLTWSGLQRCRWLDVWLARSGCVALLPGDSYNFNSVAASPVEPLVATTSGGKVRLWHLPSGQPAGELLTLERYGFGVVFSTDGRLLASGQGKHVHVWDVASQRHLAIVSGPTKQVQTVAFSSDGTLLAAGDLAGELWIWRLADGAVLQRIQAHPHFINRIAFVPGRNWLASVGDSASLRVWDVADGRLVYEVPAEVGVDDLAFTPDGTIGLLPLHQRVQRWRVADGVLLDAWAAGPGNILSIDVAPDGQTVVTGGDAGDSVARVWRLADGKPLAGLTNAERERWLRRFRTADPADRPAVLARFHQEHPNDAA